MDADAKTADGKQAFYWKAAWFSFFTSLGSTLFYFAYAKVLEKHDVNAQPSVYLTGGLLVIQIISLISGMFGMSVRSGWIKKVAAIGILTSCAMGFFAYIGLHVAIIGIKT